MSKDRVHPLKLENLEDGGQLDEFSNSLNKNEDYVDARGLVVQNDFSNDENVYVTRDSFDNLIFYDPVVGAEKSLFELKARNIEVVFTGQHGAEAGYQIKNKQWQRCGVIRFGGTTKMGIPKNFKAIVKHSKSSGSVYLRVVDLTNNNIICENNVVGNEESILDLGTLSDLPSNEAMLEVQGKKTGSGSGYIFCLGMDF